MPQGYFQFEVANRLAIFCPNLVDTQKILFDGGSFYEHGQMFRGQWRLEFHLVPLFDFIGWMGQTMRERTVVGQDDETFALDAESSGAKKADGFVLPLSKRSNTSLSAYSSSFEHMNPLGLLTIRVVGD